MIFKHFAVNTQLDAGESKDVGLHHFLSFLVQQLVLFERVRDQLTYTQYHNIA